MNPAFIILGAILAVFLIVIWSALRLGYMADAEIEQLLLNREENRDA